MDAEGTFCVVLQRWMFLWCVQKRNNSLQETLKQSTQLLQPKVRVPSPSCRHTG